MENISRTNWEKVNSFAEDRFIREIIARTRRGLQEIYGEQLDQIILFGSQARGDAQLDSDIAILIEFRTR